MDRLRLCRHLSFYIYVSVNLMSLIYSRTSSRLRHEPLQKDLLIMSNVHPEHQQRLLLPLSEGPMFTANLRIIDGGWSQRRQSATRNICFFYLLHAPKLKKQNEPMTILTPTSAW